jgi:hypothetical protein
MHVLCASLGQQKACLSYIYGQGLSLFYDFLLTDIALVDSCPVSTAVPSSAWTNVELRFDATSGLLQAVIGGAITNCQPMFAPPGNTIAKAAIGLRPQGSSDVGHTIKLDNVVVSVTR